MPLPTNPDYTVRYLVETVRIEGKGPGTEEWKSTLPMHLQWVAELEKENKFGPHGPVCSPMNAMRPSYASVGSLSKSYWSC